MEPRLAILKRLGAVYGLIEEMHSLEARVAAGQMAEVESAIDAEQDSVRAVRIRQRESLHGEDLLGRSALAVCEELAIQRNRQLEPVRRERLETFNVAQLRYADSRMWSERMKTLIKSELARLSVEQERRTQATSDDRFLAQRRTKFREQRPTE